MSSYAYEPMPAPPSPTTEVPVNLWIVDLVFAIATLLFAGAAAGVVLGATTTGGKVVGGGVFGVVAVLCLAGWINAHRHPQELWISDEAVVGGYRGRQKHTTLPKSAGADLAFVLVRAGRGAHWSLTQPGSDVRVDVQYFKMPELVRACQAHGWRVLDGAGPRQVRRLLAA
jgi:hypothetical protein